jgi:uncharacterized protein
MPPQAFELISEEVNKSLTEGLTVKGGLLDSLRPIYSSHLTHDEIRGLVNFHKSDLGQKTVKVMPQLMREAQVIGQRWGEQVETATCERVVKRLKEQGIDLEAPTTPVPESKK